MVTPTYDILEPNLAEVDIAGAMVKVKWKCPMTGKLVGRSEAKMAAVSSAKTRIESVARKSAMREFFRYLGSQVAYLIPGAAGRVARTTVTVASFDMVNRGGGSVKPRYDENSERKAVVEAFQGIKHKFRWDEDRELYVAV